MMKGRKERSEEQGEKLKALLLNEKIFTIYNTRRPTGRRFSFD